ncbi:MAG: HlyC/CorC family transporter [Alphaproteobacteria bacterium]|jgi:Mg2+/Co2+ transporter CorB|nr:HlyC/CorC family transporter [Alphaproteobacteria bacterium]
MLTTIFTIAILLVLSAFFSGSETALTAASRPVMHQLERDGNLRAKIVNRMFDHKERLIGAILLGNNLVNIFASALATSLLILFFGDAGVAYATIAMTLMILVFSEILPKTYAIRNANQAALAIAPTVKTMVWVLTPVTATINVVVRGILKIFGVDYHAEDIFGSGAEELRGAIELHSGEDKSIKQERDMLRSVLDLGEVQVGEIIIHRKNVTTVNADLEPAQLVTEVLQSPYTRLPLWQNDPDNIVGVLHVKALFNAIRALGEDLTGLDVLSLAADPWFIPEQTLLVDQLEAFRKRREHFALVVDEYGSLMGVVTLEDIIEEIVGDIVDEHDVSVSGVSPRPDGSFLVDGAVTLRDLNREFEWDLPDEEASTVAGLVLHESRRIPEIGQRFLFHDFRFEIISRHRHQITRVRLTPPTRVKSTPPE